MQRYRGIAYPIYKSSVGLLRNTDDISQIKSDMASIILTDIGERVMQPDFGVNLRVNMNQPKEMITGIVRQRIAKALKKWEKRVQVTNILVNLLVEENNEIFLQTRVLFIDPVNLNKTEELNIEKFIGVYNGERMPF